MTMVEFVLSLKNYYSQIVIRIVVAENASVAIFCIFYLFCLLVLVPCTDNTPIPIDDTRKKLFQITNLWLENKGFAQSARAISFPFCCLTG
jgi:hypothetical protein